MKEIIGLIVQYGSLALTGALALCVLVGIIYGLIRGAKRSFVRFCLILLCLILAAVFAPVSLDTILTTPSSSYSFVPGIDGVLGEAETLEEFVLTTIEEAVQGTVDPHDLPNTIKAAFGIVGMLASLFMFVMIFVVLRIVTWVLFLFIKLFFFGRDRRDKREAKRGNGVYKKRRLLGAGIGLVQGVAIMLAFIVPVAALLDTTNSFKEGLGTAQVQTTEESGGIAEVLELLDALNDAYEKSLPGSIYKGMGLDKLIYDKLTSVTIDGETISLQSLAKMAGEIYPILTDMPDLSLPENYTEQQFQEYIDSILSLASKIVDVVLSNGLVRIALNDIGTAIQNGDIDIEALVAALLSGSNQPEESNLLKTSITRVDDEEPTPPTVDLTQVLVGLLVDIVNEAASSGDFAQNLQDTLNEVIDLVSDLNDDGIIYTVMQLTGDEAALEGIFNDVESAKNIGYALDEILKTNLGAKIFSALDSIIAESLQGFGLPLDGVDLTKINWESVMETAVELFSVMDELQAGNITSEMIMRIIGTLEGQLTNGEDVSGIIEVFEGLIKTAIIDMGFAGIDEEFMDGKSLEILQNKEAIGALIDLMNDQDLYDRLSQSAANLSEDSLDDINALSVHINKLDNATPGFKAIINEVIASLMGQSVSGDAIKTLVNSLEAFKLLIEMNNMVASSESLMEDLGNWSNLDTSDKEKILEDFGFTVDTEELMNATPEEITEILTEQLFNNEKAEQLLGLVADEGIINMIEEATEGMPIAIPESQVDIVQNVLDNKIDDIAQQIADAEIPEEEKEQLQSQLDMLDKLGGMLGLDTSKIPGFPRN